MGDLLHGQQVNPPLNADHTRQQEELLRLQRKILDDYDPHSPYGRTRMQQDEFLRQVYREASDGKHDDVLRQLHDSLQGNATTQYEIKVLRELQENFSAPQTGIEPVDGATPRKSTFKPLPSNPY